MCLGVVHVGVGAPCILDALNKQFPEILATSVPVLSFPNRKDCGSRFGGELAGHGIAWLAPLLVPEAGGGLVSERWHSAMGYLGECADGEINGLQD